MVACSFAKAASERALRTQKAMSRSVMKKLAGAFLSVDSSTSPANCFLTCIAAAATDIEKSRSDANGGAIGANSPDHQRDCFTLLAPPKVARRHPIDTIDSPKLIQKFRVAIVEACNFAKLGAVTLFIAMRRR